MKRDPSKMVFIAALLAVTFSACHPSAAHQEIPEVNQENCNPDKIAKMRNKDARSEFSGLCIRRNTFKPSPKRSW